MTYAEMLSIRLNDEQLSNIIHNTGSRGVNSFALKQAKFAYRYRHDDAKVLEKLVTIRSGQKFKSLYTNGSAVFDSLKKYHTVKYAMGALTMMILRATHFDQQQTSRILHRSPAFKFWSNPLNPVAATYDVFTNWNRIYMTTNVNVFNAKTRGEIYMKDLTDKMQQPMGVE